MEGMTYSELMSGEYSKCPHCRRDPTESELVTARIHVLSEALKAMPAGGVRQRQQREGEQHRPTSSSRLRDYRIEGINH